MIDGIEFLLSTIVVTALALTQVGKHNDNSIKPRNEILNRPEYFMMGNQYSPKFNKK
jgi:hypothetical protein